MVIVTLAGLCLAMGGMPAALLLYQRVEYPPPYTDARLRAGLGLSILVALAVAAYVRVVEGRSLASAGVGLDPVQVLAGLVASFCLAIVGTGAVIVVLQLLDAATIDDADVLSFTQPWHWKVMIAVVAGFTEEFVYRGYLIERLLEFGVSPLVAGGVSAVAFTVAHLPGREPRAVLPGVSVMAIGFVAAYLLTRSVVGLALGHMCINLFLLLTTSPADIAEEADLEQLDDRVLRRLPLEGRPSAD